jgi:NAD(P)-dependent dehydrogenase (short-subunit alcohol dehydrogenase family)
MPPSAPDPAVTLVTGGIRGIGLAVARRLAARGDRVHLAYRSSSSLAAGLGSEFPAVHRADLTREEEWTRLVAAVLARDGRLDHVVHAVGEYVTGPLAASTPADLRRMLASNVESAFLALGECRSALRASRGSAVFFGCAGLEGSRARRRTAVYGAAKSALLVLVRSAALEEAPHGVRINAISPGTIPHDHASADTRDPEHWRKIPLGRPGRPDEVAAAAAWLTSSEASYVTGANLEVAGGWMLG